MGISCDLEVGSMDSETKPTCNRDSLKPNGQVVCDAVAEATTAKTPLSIVVDTIDASSSTTSVIDLVSPTPKEAEPILIGDDAEPEEGEIINTDSDFEYEDISSDEEFTLRQQIEALEAKNRELEKIASISSRAIDYDYIGDYHRPSIYSNYKIPLAPNRSNIAKTNPPLSSNASNFKPLPLSHVECISSDEAQIIDSENELPYVFDGGSSNSSKLYGRSHRSTAPSSSSSSKKEKRQSRRNKTRTGIDGIASGDKERCLLHGKRRCADLSCSIVEVPSRKKRTRHKYDSDRKVAKPKYSSDSEDELLRNREELKMALNIIEPAPRTTVNTTLSHKLSAIQNQHQSAADGKKSTAKHRKRKNSHSPDRESTSKRSKHPKTNAISEFPDRKSEQIKIKTSQPLMGMDVKHNEDDDDEQISLEEQELRLIALKSAVLKKHEARKRKQLAQACEQIARPYSPTDSIVLVADEAGDEQDDLGGERSNDFTAIDSDSNNMDISPISSPTNQYQPMDMDLVSSNENSKSPIFSYEKPQTFPSFDSFIDWGTVHIPVPINPAAAATYVDIDPTACALNQPQFTLQPSYSLIYDANMPKEPIPMVENPSHTAIQSDAKENEPNDNEADELRAKLIEQMRATTLVLPNDASEPNYDVKSMPKKEDGDGHYRVDPLLNVAPKEVGGTNNVDSLEEDCLRSLLLSSKGKKSNILKETTNEPLHAVPHEHLSKSNANKVAQSKSCDDIPKLTLNLREALKRLKSNQQNKNIAPNSSSMPSIGRDESNRLDNTHEDENANNRVKSLQDCDHNEIQKTVVNKHRIDAEESEKQPSIGQVIRAAEAPSTETKLKVLNIVTNEPNESAKKSTATKTPTAVAKPFDIIVPVMAEQKTATDVAKTIFVSATKTTEKLVNKKEPTKKVTNQKSAIKVATTTTAAAAAATAAATAIPKPKQNLSTIESEPLTVVTVPLRPKSSTPPTTVPKVNASIGTSASSLSLNKMELIRKSTSSPIITTWTAKPVKKLIISLNEDSSTDDTDDAAEFSTITKTNNNSTTNEPLPNTFQVRLDQFLQSVRANTTTTATSEKKQPTKPSATKKIPTMPKTTTDKKDSPQKNQTSTSKLESSKAVAHLPISSQLEYHRLLNRMKLLEKQKEQKSRLKSNEQQQPTSTALVAKTVPTPAVESNFPRLTVVVQNENRIIQTNKALKPTLDDSDKKPSDLMKVVNKSPLTTSSVSLAKKVLVKNAMDSLNTPKVVTNELNKRSTDNNEKVEVKNEPNSTLPTVSNAAASGDKESGAKAKPTVMSLAMFAKKSPKVRATVLANYVKKYRNQGEQYLCGLAKLYRLTNRTNLETRKQQKLEESLDELRRQTKIAEEKLAQQKTLTQSLYPAMAAAEKATNADRIVMQKLENCCKRLGNIVNGAEYKIQSDKESEIKNKIIQITIEKNKLKLLAQNKPVTTTTTTTTPAQVSKSVATKLTTVPSKPSKVSSMPSPSLSSPKQQLQVKPNVLAVQLQNIPNPMPEQTDKPENDQKIESVKCEPTESTQKDCIKVDAPKQIDEGDKCIDNNVTDKEDVDCKPPVEMETIQKESSAHENLNDPIESENKIGPNMDSTAGNDIAKNEPNQSMVTEMEITQTNDNNRNCQPIISDSNIAEAMENVIESDQKIDEKSLNPDNLTVTKTMTENNVIGDDNETQHTNTGKYDSPLDHLENCVEIQQSGEQLSDADRNAILCPYDLMGRCEDKQCKYKHIKM